MKLFAAAMVLLLPPLSASAGQTTIPVAELTAAQARACPVATRLAERYGISFSGFTATIPASNPPDMSADDSFVRMRLPEPAYVSDGFHHTAVVSRTTRKAWILRTGGFVDRYEWYGPVDADAGSLDDCLPRTTAAAKQDKNRS
jgi:hypothetical protein